MSKNVIWNKIKKIRKYNEEKKKKLLLIWSIVTFIFVVVIWILIKFTFKI